VWVPSACVDSLLRKTRCGRKQLSLGLDPALLFEEVSAGKGDGEILEWVLSHAKTPRAPWEIEAWSAYFDKRGPDSDAETLSQFAEYVGQHTKTREDISRHGSTHSTSMTMSALAVKREQRHLRCVRERMSPKSLGVRSLQMGRRSPSWSGACI
jgi:uncharacterized protein DUF5069